MAWLWLVSAGLLEILFVSCLKLSEEFTKPLYTVAFIISSILSFWFLTKAIQVIPVGTAYAVWTGIGAAGIIVISIVFFGEPAGALRLFFVFLLIVSIVALKLLSVS